MARAFAWTYKNVAKHGGRADRLFLCGHSAGAHLISLLATDKTYLEAEGRSSKDIYGVIPISGPFVIPDRFMANVFGPEGHKASPIAHARADVPPFLILYGEKDMPGCDRRPAEAFRKALETKGNTVRSEELAGMNHFTIIAGAVLADNPVHKAIVSFVKARCEK